MSGKRTKVPAALHSELSEYSSLLRALRTSNTLDLASQLTTHASGSRDVYADTDEDEDVAASDDDSVHPPTATLSSSQKRTGTSFSSSNESGPSKTAAKRKKTTKAPRDTWTRWPLLAGDVHVPEWSLEDEVRLLAIRYLKTVEPSSADPKLSDLEDTAESLLTSHASRALTESTGRHLSEILALLAAYLPSGEKSMQNRIRPMNWESVLTIASASRLISPESLQVVRDRLSRIYACSGNAVIHNYPIASKRTASDFEFLVIDGYDPSVELPDPNAASFPKAGSDRRKRKAPPRKKRKTDSAN